MTITTCDAQGKPVAAEVGLDIMPADRGDASRRPDPGRGRWRDSSAAAIARRNSKRPPASSSIIGPPIESSARPSPKKMRRPFVADRLATGSPGCQAVAGRRERSFWRRSEPRRRLCVAPAMPRKPVRPRRNQSPTTILLARPETAPAAAASADPFGDDRRLRPTRRRQSASGPIGGPNASVGLTKPRPTWSGYWNPAITTGPDGPREISLTLPEDAMDLTLVANAITPETLAGQASQNSC